MLFFQNNQINHNNHNNHNNHSNRNNFFNILNTPNFKTSPRAILKQVLTSLDTAYLSSVEKI
jgi:hypothetical protein